MIFKLQSGNCCLQCSEGHNSKTIKPELWFLHSAYCFMMIYICVKFHKKNHEWFSSYRAETVIYNVQKGITPKLYKPRGPKLNSFELFNMPVMVTSNFDDDSIKNE